VEASADLRKRLIVALDYSDLQQALGLVEVLQPLVSHFKVGMELFYSQGPRAVEEIRRRGADVFLDLKFHDIPNTVAGAARAATRLGVSMFNLHVAGGMAMLREAVAAATAEARQLERERPLLLGMTLLTSIDERVLREEMGVPQRRPLEQVLFWAELAQRAGLDGVVASAQEVRAIKERLGPAFLVVTPGIRFLEGTTGGFPRASTGAAGAPLADDQKRVVTPAEAVAAGSDYLVVGRPITRSPDPALAAKRVLEEMKKGWEERKR